MNKSIIWLGALFFGLGFFTLVIVLIFPSDDFGNNIEGYAYSIAFIGTGLVFLIGVIYSNFDQKDHWSVELPYNKRLFEIMNKHINIMLEENGYRFEFDRKKKVGGLMECQISHSTISRLTLLYGLEIIQGKNSITYKFPIKIKNIRDDNLTHARQLCRDINEILESVNYKAYPEETGSTEGK